MRRRRTGTRNGHATGSSSRRSLAAHEARARDPAARRRRALDHRDRPQPVHQREDGEEPPRVDLRQARLPRPDPGRAERHAPRHRPAPVAVPPVGSHWPMHRSSAVVRAIEALAARQFGAFSRDQAFSLGSDASHDRAPGRELAAWPTALPRVHRVAAVPWSFRQDAMVAALWSAPDGLVSNRDRLVSSAGLEGVATTEVHVTVPAFATSPLGPCGRSSGGRSSAGGHRAPRADPDHLAVANRDRPRRGPRRRHAGDRDRVRVAP